PQPSHGAGPKPFQQDVGRSDEIPEPSLVAVRLEIERHRALVAIERGVERRKSPRGISDARTLDEDDVGPKIGHQKRRVRTVTTSEKIKPEQSVSVEVRADAVWITLNRPTALNAITPDMVAGITAALTHADDPAIKAVVSMGTGRAFCAGADLKYVNSATQGDAPAATRFLDAVLDMMARSETCPRPVIAAVNGLALAGGSELVSCCDSVIAARSAKLGDAHANFGSSPGG
ncbi:hypothetical protein OY671_008279, partial [Metschnikowia pulcherrima]